MRNRDLRGRRAGHRGNYAFSFFAALAFFHSTLVASLLPSGLVIPSTSTMSPTLSCESDGDAVLELRAVVRGKSDGAGLGLDGEVRRCNGSHAAVNVVHFAAVFVGVVGRCRGHVKFRASRWPKSAACRSATTELARSRSKLMTEELVLVTVIGPVKVTVTLRAGERCRDFYRRGRHCVVQHHHFRVGNRERCSGVCSRRNVDQRQRLKRSRLMDKLNFRRFGKQVARVAVVPLPVSVSELTESSNFTIWSFRPSVVLRVALVGPALTLLPVPPQPVARTTATITTVRSKYRFIGASKFSVSGEVLAV